MLTTTKVKRGRWLRIRGILIRVREFDHDDVVVEWKAAPVKSQKRADARNVDDSASQRVQ